MKININILKRIIQLRYFKIPEAKVQGYTSRTMDGKHCLFLDWDMCSPEIVYTDLKNLLEQGIISHAYIFTTYEETDELGVVGNYHAISIDKFNYYEIFKIMEQTHCDNLHKDLAKKTRYKAWVLRFSGKGNRHEPKFIKFIKGKENNRIQSYAHYKLIHLLNDKIDEGEYKFNFDNNTKAFITYYNSASKLTEEEIK